MATGAGGPTPTDANNLALAYSQVCANIALVTANPAMSFSENGRSVSANEYLSSQIEKQKELLAALQMANGPFDIGG